LPGLQLKDDLDLGDNGYCIYLQGTALIRQGLDPSLLYTRTDQPSEDSFALALLPHTYFKVDPDGDLTATDLLLLQLSAVVRAYAYEILSRDEVGVILERLHSRCEVVIQEVIAPEPAPGRLTIGQLTTILRYLLQEQVSIRNLPRILEILANHLPSENNLAQLAEKVRQGLARQLTAAQLNADGVLEVLTIQPEDEAAMRQDLLATGPTQAKTDWANRLTSALEAHTLPKLLLCAPDIRRALFELVSRRFPQLQVISYQEVAST